VNICGYARGRDLELRSAIGRANPKHEPNLFNYPRKHSFVSPLVA
jgi:hypothetical protein